MSSEEFMNRLLQQQYGAFIQLLLKGWEKNKIKYEMDYETEEEFQEFILEVEEFVESIPNYHYSNKINNITGGKKQVLKKISKMKRAS